MSRLTDAFQNKKAYISFLTAGDPSLDKTIEFMIALQEAGTAVIEIGIPFSDPIAEGAKVQDANVRALSAPGGCTTDMVFDMIVRAREHVHVPIVLLTYLNPVFKYGYDAFCKRCSEVGVDAIMIPDLPFVEKQELAPTAANYGVDIISIVAPTTKERLQTIAKEANGYLYVMASAIEATAANNEKISAIADMMHCVREVSDIPVVASVSESSAAQAADYAKIADGIVVDNAVVRIIEQFGIDAAAYINVYVKAMAKDI